MNLGRLITAMVTPFDQDGNIDWATTERLVNYLIEDQKTDSIVVAGTTGESPTLTTGEKEQLFKFVVEKVAGRVKVIAGTGTNSTKSTIELSQMAEKCGVDALLLVTPYYNRPTQDGLFLHFKAAAESVKIPIFLYNVEGRTGVNLLAETTIKLAESCSNIVGIKECAKLEQLAEIISAAPEGFLVYSGDDSATLPALSVGAEGIISVVSHIVGKEMKAMIEAYVSGNVKEAAAIHRQLLPTFTQMFAFQSPIPVKYAMECVAFPVGDVRLPLAPISGEQKAFVRQIPSVVAKLK